MPEHYCGDPGPHERHRFDEGYSGELLVAWKTCRGVPDEPRDPPRCEHRAVKGTGYGTCDRLLDAHGQCDRASSHA